MLDEHTYRCVVRDNGIGVPTEIDWYHPDSLGLRLVHTLVSQLNGTIELDRTNGTEYTIVVHSSQERERPGGATADNARNETGGET